MRADYPPLNLIRIFDFYVILMFIVSFVRRWRVYWNAVRILVSVRGRWPKLIERLGEHKSVLLNWAFFRPAILAGILTVVQLVFSYLIFPYAVLTGPQLREEWWWILLILVPMIPMLCVDVYFILYVGKFDHAQTVKYLDKAESWLGWKGKLVRIVTLGTVNPKKIVDKEVQKSLEDAHSMLSSSLWWVSLQIGLRLAFGITLWTVWAIHASS